jgi:spermidine synthase
MIKKLLSHIGPFMIARYDSALSGPLDVRLEKGHLALNSAHANYSFSRIHAIMRIAIRSSTIASKHDGQILNLGMAAGTSVQVIREDLKLDYHIVSVEKDPVIIEIAKTHFNIQRFENHQIIEADARDYLKASTQLFDLIIVDVFIDTQVPAHIKSEGFIGLVINHLKPDGQAVFNHMKVKGEHSYAELLGAHPGQVQKVKLKEPYNEVLIYTQPSHKS